MAQLVYGAEGEPIQLPEELLAHIKVVMTAKLRRNESFLMTWRHADDAGRSAVWVQPSIPLFFTFDDPEPPALDHALLTRLAAAANSNGGLVLDLRDGVPQQLPVRHAGGAGGVPPREAQPAA
jgi:hypothetical protein